MAYTCYTVAERADSKTWKRISEGVCIINTFFGINLAYPKEELIAFIVGNVRSNPDSDIFTVKVSLRRK